MFFLQKNSKLKKPLDAENVTKKALIVSALTSAKRAEELGLKKEQIIISCKVSELHTLVEVYDELAKKCNECALHHFKEFDNKLISYKDDNSPLTNADIEVNDIAVAGLHKLFPSVKIISEELYKSNDEFKNKKYFWLIDPIDGTKEFINKRPNFTVNFALIKHNSPIFGLIAQPTTGTIWYNFNYFYWFVFFCPC